MAGKSEICGASKTGSKKIKCENPDISQKAIYFYCYKMHKQ